MQGRETEDLLHAIVNNSDDGIGYYTAIRDKNGRIIDFKIEYLNESALKYLKGNRDDFIGKPLLNFVKFNLMSGLHDAFVRVFETGQTIKDIFHNTAGEYEGWYKNTIIKYDEGILVYFSNDTERKILELQLKEKNASLEHHMEEKDKVIRHNELLLKEIHHRVKNNLQIISSLLNLQAGISTDAATVQSLREAIQRVSSVAAVHEQLYRNIACDRILLADLIKDIIGMAGSFYGYAHRETAYHIKIDPVMLDISCAVNIGLILNELITNSYKYGLDNENGIICIEAEAAGKGVKLLVKDNGPGLPSGFDIKKTKTLGLILVESLVEQMEGQLTIESEGGACFRMHIPRTGRFIE